MRESTFLTDFDRFLIGKGSHERTYEKLGAHLVENCCLWGEFGQWQEWNFDAGLQWAAFDAQTRFLDYDRGALQNFLYLYSDGDMLMSIAGMFAEKIPAAPA